MYPIGLQTVTVTTGPHLAGGLPVGGTVTLTPRYPVTHVPSGTPISAAPVVGTINPTTGLGSVTVPASDAAGLDRTELLYRAEVRLTGAPGPTPKWVRLPAESPAIDLEALLPVTNTTGSTAWTPVVTSLAGISGSITAAQLAALVDAAAVTPAELAAALALLDLVTDAELATALATKANTSALAAKADVTALAAKADLTAGKVPDAQLPTRLGDTQLRAAFASRRLSAYMGLPSLGDASPVSDAPPTVAVAATSSATSPIAGTSLAHSTTLVTKRRGRFAAQTINSNTYQQNQINNPSTSRSPSEVEFLFTGTEFAVKLYNAIAGTSGFRLWVDGLLASAAATATAGGSTQGQPYWATITFPATSTRRIRIEFVGGAIFGGLGYAATAAASPVSDRLPRCAVYGDSWVGGANNVLDYELLAYRLGRELGWETARLGHGGSGYVQDGSGAGVAYTDATRVAEIISYKPEYAVIIGSINDDSHAASAVTAAATNLYAQIAAGSPATRVIVVGPQGLPSATPAGRLANRDAVKAAALAAPNVVAFIDPLALGWITGTGDAGAPTGDGNADTYIAADRSHPTAAGHSYWANKVATEVLRVT